MTAAVGALYYVMMGTILLFLGGFLIYRIVHLSVKGSAPPFVPGVPQPTYAAPAARYKSALVEGTKLCPACAEAIQGMAKKCRHCGEWFEIVKPRGRDVE
ncbi:MAG: hypothetical protein HY720_28750 [Planctomycetes bacterium]|nr:hypothetical protein [Planctomycetota bacterium]